MERFLRAGARHGVQNIVKDILHCIAAGAGLFGQAQTVAGRIGKNRGNILRGHIIAPAQKSRRARHTGHCQRRTGRKPQH